jgi:hypothetical protein
MKIVEINRYQNVETGKMEYSVYLNDPDDDYNLSWLDYQSFPNFISAYNFARRLAHRYYVTRIEYGEKVYHFEDNADPYRAERIEREHYASLAYGTDDDHGAPTKVLDDLPF